MSWVEEKYIGMLSNRLDRFTRKNNTFNFRCPICGDSKRDRSKTRGYILQKEGAYRYYCHNCGASYSLAGFFKVIDVKLHDEYVKERFLQSNSQIQIPQAKPDLGTFIKPKFSKYGPLKELKRISQLQADHPVKRYVESRKIPSKMHYKLFYAPKFKSFVNKLIPEKFLVDENHPDEPRLIIPFLDEYSDVFGFQGRSFKKDGLRYITIILNDEKPKLFGLDSVEKNRNIYITEGPIDSMFLDNAIAMAGSDVSDIQFLGQDVTFVYDNEPRNKEIVKKIEKAIDKGYKVVIWPSSVKEKDLNDMILSGMKMVDLELLVRQNTKSGLEAKLALSVWKKV